MSNYLSAMFARRQNDGWFRVGRFDATTVDIVCALGVASMFLYGISRSAFNNLVFVPFLVRDFEIWRLITWPIATQPNIFALINIVFFWSFGQQIEAMFGRNRFVAWLLAVTLVPSVLLTVLSAVSSSLEFATVEFGISTLFLCGIWVYAASYPGVRFFEVVPLWALAAVFTVLNILQYSGERAGGPILFLLAAIAAALFMARSLGFATGWPIPHVPLTIGEGSSGSRSGGGRGRSSKPKRGKASRGGQRVVEGPWQRGAAPEPPKVAPSPADQAELDSLLDKIGEQGMDSLSSHEKRRLNELSKRLRD